MIMNSAVLCLVLSFVIVLFTNIHFKQAKRAAGSFEHCIICAAAVVAGCVIRFCEIGSLPAGLNAEEALSAVQAKALWQTGGFLFDGRLTAQFQQWTGETGGPFLAFFAAPFVGLMGMSMTSIRLALTVLSCAAMFAAYGIGQEISGKRAARWMLVIYALCPTFILDARFAASANAAVFLMPIAFYALIRGFRQTPWLYVGMVLAGMLAYTYDIYFFIVPLVILAAVCTAKASGIKMLHCAAAGCIGLLHCVPALLTIWVNLSGAEGFALFDWITIPELEGFSKNDFIWTGSQDLVQASDAIRNQICAILYGSLLQSMRHENITHTLFAPEGFLNFHTMSVPLIFLGILVFLNDGVGQAKEDSCTAAKRRFLLVSGIAVFAVIVLVGNQGMYDYSGGTSVYDYSSLHLFVALLMTDGLCRIEKKSTLGRWGILGLFTVSTAMLCVFLFGGTYNGSTNTHFYGLENAYQRAAQLQEENGHSVYVTTTVYPHMDPGAASEIMYLYASDADMHTVLRERDRTYSAVYLQGMESLDRNAIYVAKESDLYSLNLDNWQYEGFGEYGVLFAEN